MAYFSVAYASQFTLTTMLVWLALLPAFVGAAVLYGGSLAITAY
ncbi:MAG TPA: hypothetical protein VG125_19770 [Pirellulales bacterium]|jgi:hypothetical protein|nr:hypothetical protein [Pirellulales bacterium]